MIRKIQEHKLDIQELSFNEINKIKGGILWIPIAIAAGISTTAITVIAGAVLGIIDHTKKTHQNPNTY